MSCAVEMPCRAASIHHGNTARHNEPPVRPPTVWRIGNGQELYVCNLRSCRHMYSTGTRIHMIAAHAKLSHGPV